MNNKYQIELDEFNENFKEFKQSKIVLYGIGRYTATLVEGLQDFDFVGLMDKDSANTGKIMFGLPIISKEEAEHKADLVVINTSETYWNVIYNRIEDIQIPVYYKNGERAEKKKKQQYHNPYKELSWETLKNKIKEAEIISFDFFDTLFVRNVCNPRDVFYLLEEEIREVWNANISFVEARNKAIEKIDKNYSLDELYQKMQEITEFSCDTMQCIKEKELALEKKLLKPRKQVLELFGKCLNRGKEVYLISDMYLPKSFYLEVFQKYDIEILEEKIILSNEWKKSKSEGNLWKDYSEKIVKGRKALHIGDNEKADICIPKKYGMDIYLIPSVWDMMMASSVGEVASYINTIYSSMSMATMINKWFEDPYVMYGKDGRMEIQTPENMGYMVFGPVIYTYLMWLLRQAEEENISKLVFMSRDGYFLKEDFEYLCELLDKKQESCYIGISRQLVMMASITDDNSLLEYANMPYSGSIKELFVDRFGIEIKDNLTDKELKDYIELYKNEIIQILKIIRKNYLQYLKRMNLDNTCAVVDLGYYGNNQRYLNKLLDLNMQGYYFNVNGSEKNINTKYQSMKGCFQTTDDLTGEKSQVLKNMIFIESFLTAPYGMIKEIDEDGNFICAEKKMNQVYFDKKIEINNGVKQYIDDFVNNFGFMQIVPEREFTDKYYGLAIKKVFGFADEVKQSFYNDNAMMNRIESMLFY